MEPLKMMMNDARFRAAIMAATHECACDIVMQTGIDRRQAHNIVSTTLHGILKAMQDAGYHIVSPTPPPNPTPCTHPRICIINARCYDCLMPCSEIYKSPPWSQAPMHLRDRNGLFRSLCRGIGPHEGLTDNHDLVTCEPCKRVAQQRQKCTHPRIDIITKRCNDCRMPWSQIRAEHTKAPQVDTTINDAGEVVMNRDVEKGELYRTAPEHMQRAAEMIGDAKNGMLPDALRDDYLERLAPIIKNAADKPQLIQKSDGATP
jgi:hypothetical protein